MPSIRSPVYSFSGWQEESMGGPRVMGDATLLPNGQVVILNGARVNGRVGQGEFAYLPSINAAGLFFLCNFSRLMLASIIPDKMPKRCINPGMLTSKKLHTGCLVH